jgi:hypothetical protein
MHVLTTSLGLVALFAAQVAGQSAPSSNDNLYANYDYCQGVTPIAGKTYKPIVSPRIRTYATILKFLFGVGIKIDQPPDQLDINTFLPLFLHGKHNE